MCNESFLGIYWSFEVQKYLYRGSLQRISLVKVKEMLLEHCVQA
jgi:hypothetical protein